QAGRSSEGGDASRPSTKLEGRIYMKQFLRYTPRRGGPGGPAVVKSHRDGGLRWARRMAVMASIGVLGFLFSVAVTGSALGTTTVPSTTTTGVPCTSAHPCANPSCAQASHGPLDCSTPTTTTTTEPTTTTTLSTPVATTTTVATTTAAATTTATATTTVSLGGTTTTSAAAKTSPVKTIKPKSAVLGFASQGRSKRVDAKAKPAKAVVRDASFTG